MHPSEYGGYDYDGDYYEYPIYQDSKDQFTLHNWKSRYHKVRVYPNWIKADDYASDPKDNKTKGDASDKYDKFDKYRSSDDLKKAKKGSVADQYDHFNDAEPNEPYMKRTWPAYKKEKVRVKKFEHNDRVPRYVDEDEYEYEVRPAAKLSHEQRARAAVLGLQRRNVVRLPSPE